MLDELGIDREPGRWSSCARRRRPRRTTRDNPLYDGVLDRLAADGGATAVVIPRTERAGRRVRERASELAGRPRRAIDAQSLIAYADLVVSAGGTMNREAVALGTPVYTIFSGEMGAVDERLIARGPAAAARRPGRARAAKARATPGVREPRDPQMLVDADSGSAS